MKGAVFIALNDMVEEEYGIEAWEEILAEVKPECGGVYTSTNDYPDAEVVDYVLVISKKLSLDPEVVTRIFGTYLFGDLNKKFPIFTQLTSGLFDFICSIESVIHKEVRKLYDNPSLPSIDCHIEDANTLHMEYSSPRKLCYLAEGLVYGAAEFYGEKVSISHNRCMHDGESSCHLQVNLDD